MHIDDCTYSRGEKTYRRVLLRNSYRVNGKIRHDTIANLSKCNDDEIAAFKFALKNKENLNKLGISDNIKTRQGLSVGAVWVFSELSKRFGIVKALGQSRNAMLVLWMVFATIISQGSRLSAVRLAQQHAICDILDLDTFNEDDLYSAMSWLADQQGTIEKSLFVNYYQNGKNAPNLFLYDVTSSYLEGEQNELGLFGYNRDKKEGKQQIVIGLLTDNNGRPVSVEVFKGNTQDPQTVSSQITKLRDRFGVKHITLVGDRGMLKSAQIESLESVGFNFITAITKPQILKLINDKVIDISLFDNEIVEIIDNKIRYVLRKNPFRADEMAATREKKWSSILGFIDKQNIYLKEHSRAQQNVALRKAQEKLKRYKFDGWATINLDGQTLTIICDEEKKQEFLKLDGCYVLKTDLSAEASLRQDVHDRYKELANVEKAFRTMKTTLLEMRGIFVRKENHTRAHVFIIMLAYLLAFELNHYWRDIEATVEEGIAELVSICTIYVDVDSNAVVQTIPEPRPLGKSLLEKLKIILPDVIPHKNVIVDTRKKLVPERKHS